ncbi:prolyl oligopeptidase family serine peptidase [Myroides odoratus]|uniref:alpha/beta hydrolase family protein n=1 Tax=Myroides odoratus TaxID=256 RepID=UPI00334296AF
MNIKINNICSIILLVICNFSINGQTIKDSLKYSELRNSALSDNGKISVVHKYYKADYKKDSVFIFNSGKLILSKQSNYLYEPFKENILTSYNVKKKELEFLNCTTSKSQIIHNVTEHLIIREYGLVFFLDANTSTYKLSKILQNQIQEIWSSPKSLTNFTQVSDNNQTLLIQYNDLEKGIELINLSDFKKTINKDINYRIKQVKWSKRYPIVFLFPTPISDNKYPYLTFFNLKTNTSINQSLDDNISYNNVETTSDNSFKITQSYSLGNLPYNAKEVELWSTKDRYLRNILTVSEASIQEYRANNHIVFDYENKAVYQPKVLDNYESVPLNKNTFLIFNSNQYLDYTYAWSSRPRDISLYDIKSNSITTITKRQESPFNTTSLSPKGNYFMYIKDNSMHFYNIKDRIIENSFKLKIDSSRLRIFAGPRLWSNNERYFYFVSNCNLMQYDTRNKNFKILLNGNNIDSRYQIINSKKENIFDTNSELHYQSISNLDNKLLVHKLNIKDNTHSLILLENDKQKTIIKATEERISDIKYSDDFKTITYSVENFNKPKTVFVYQDGKTMLLLDNTMPKELYKWQKQKIISYKDQYGNDLKGILFYPKDFDPYKKYPMITSIYEIQFHLKSNFTYPTYLNDTGFNISLLQENNYFVFLPDILDIKQGTGLSALHCVEEGLKSVLKGEKAIDQDNLGLFGFSHGGYEANFIVTQTDLFKAAVSGSGNSDIIRSYFSYNENFISPFFFQFENGQYKMPKTFSEDKTLFLKNSPILFVDQIKTPILTFTGKQDENIHWEQQREFFIGMLRYKIPHVALFYKDEGHGILKKENQIDLTKRLMNWFDYFLKSIDTKETQWVKYYTTFEKNS